MISTISSQGMVLNALTVSKETASATPLRETMARDMSRTRPRRKPVLSFVLIGYSPRRMWQ